MTAHDFFSQISFLFLLLKFPVDFFGIRLRAMLSPLTLGPSGERLVVSEAGILERDGHKKCARADLRSALAHFLFLRG
jgi:hypothetical protein